MSSATRYNPDAFRVAAQQGDQTKARIARLGLSPRQQDLNRAWSYYCTEQYAIRIVGWDGRKVMTDLEIESISHNAVLPPGFWDPGGRLDEVPLALRKPPAPYHVVRVVVNRFTSILFSASKHPRISVEGDPATQSWVEGLAEASHLWIRFAVARMFGGAMGSVGLTFKYVNGSPVIEVHDPRWCVPTFKDRSTGELSKLEIRYQHPVEMYDADGILQQVPHWYRRVIDETMDVVFAPAPVGDGDEPTWVAQTTVMHNLGFFPGVWIRNTPTDDVDGEEDCVGQYDTAHEIDSLIGQGSYGAKENCDPTMVVASDQLKLGDIRKGSRNALKLEKGATASYMEATGTGVTTAMAVAATLRRNFLEVAQCVLDGEDGGAAMTATEVERRYSTMHSRGDIFREQYGEFGVKPLIEKMIRAARKLATGAVQEDGTRLAGVVILPQCLTAEGTLVDRVLGPGRDFIKLSWPAWVQRGPVDAQAAAGATAVARAAKVIDIESACNYLAPYFNIDNPAEMLKRLRVEIAETSSALESSLLRDPIVRETRPDEQPMPAAGAPATGEAVQTTAFNGAQIASMLEIVTAVSDGKLLPDSAIEIIATMFPVSRQQAIDILGKTIARGTPPPVAPVEA